MLFHRLVQAAVTEGTALTTPAERGECRGKRGYRAHCRRQSPTVPQNKQPEFLAMPTAAKKATTRGAKPVEAVSRLADVTDRMHGLIVERRRAHGLRKIALKRPSWRRSPM